VGSSSEAKDEDGGASDGSGRGSVVSHVVPKLVKLREYRGERGECGEWWLSTQMVFSALKTPEPNRLGSVMLALKDAAMQEFWSALQALKGQGSGTPAVSDVMDVVIAVFDGGMAPKYVMDFLKMEQEGDEPALVFRSRFMQAVRAMQTLGLVVPEPLLAVMFGVKLRDWPSIAVKSPQSVADVLRYLNEAGLEDKSDNVGLHHAFAARFPDRRGQRTMSGSKCWVCGKRGHFAARCKKKKQDSDNEQEEFKPVGAAMLAIEEPEGVGLGIYD
jgi:hypothetical protein